MKLYKITLRLVSPLGTPLMSDTIFGHICWSKRYHHGTDKLAEFLDQMKSDKPAIILSDAFRAGSLPVPVLPAEVPQYKSIEHADQIKKAGKQRYIKAERLLAMAESVSSSKLLHELIETAIPEKPTRHLVTHNAVNRFGAGTCELFSTEEAFFSREGAQYDMIVGSWSYSAEQIADIFKLAFADGYGRDKSIGKGVIEVTAIENFELPQVANPNAVMLLGRCAPARHDPTEGYWQLVVKEGKLGGHWAVSYDHRKKPVIMLSAGSVLFTDRPKPYYGRIIENVHNTLPEVVHYGYAPAMPIAVHESEVL